MRFTPYHSAIDLFLARSSQKSILSFLSNFHAEINILQNQVEHTLGGTIVWGTDGLPTLQVLYTVVPLRLKQSCRRRFEPYAERHTFSQPDVDTAGCREGGAVVCVC